MGSHAGRTLTSPLMFLISSGTSDSDYHRVDILLEPLQVRYNATEYTYILIAFTMDRSTSIDRLPHEILAQIFLHMPPADLGNVSDYIPSLQVRHQELHLLQAGQEAVAATKWSSGGRYSV